ncbi:metallophosphoesterase family protein [Cohnella terricola]|uniref:Metallophosphoesterase n=1 Tax=Cohnella terricola TaxID=1289167 RepID=A0A559J9C2_9BACL|nr:metallophosphoesterase [Cohnella terricola]TVX96452.1 metallophosphoesterase [Cohnella terricola]
MAVQQHSQLDERRSAEERPIVSFQVITDTHVRAESEHVHNRNLDKALKDILVNCPDSIGIMHVGDVTDHGLDAEFAELHRILADNAAELPRLLLTTGNHDVGLGIWESRIGRFLKETGMQAPYHDHWIAGYHFIFLGTERGLELFCDLSDEQLTWLEAKLAENSVANKPKFLFLHQPLLDTVGGSFKAQGWYGVTQDERVKEILSNYPNVVLFTGHTHWELEAGYARSVETASMPAMFNAASVAYLWTDLDEHKDGSQGYYVDVYEDKVLVKGRDFTTGTWIPGAQFEVPSRR